MIDTIIKDENYYAFDNIVQHKKYIKLLGKSGRVVYDYNTGCSVSALAKKYRVGRNSIEKIIKESGTVLRGFIHTEESRNKLQEAMKQTLQERYGVDNIGQKTGGFSSQNKIPYTKPQFVDDFMTFKKAVGYETQRTLRKINKPLCCEVTGIMFADAHKPANPNDYYKRSVDHKVSILECFLLNKSPEEAAARENVIFVLRYINTIKGNMPYDLFIKYYGNSLTELLIQR